MLVDRIGTETRNIETSHLGGAQDLRFNNWYRGEGAEKFARFQAFRYLDSPMRSLHDYGQKAIQQFRNSELNYTAETLREMEKISDRIVSLFLRLEAALH